MSNIDPLTQQVTRLTLTSAAQNSNLNLNSKSNTQTSSVAPANQTLTDRKVEATQVQIQKATLSDQLLATQILEQYLKYYTQHPEETEFLLAGKQPNLATQKLFSQISENALNGTWFIKYNDNTIGFFLLEIEDEKTDINREHSEMILTISSLILQEFQGKGIGKIAKKEFLKICDSYIGQKLNYKGTSYTLKAIQSIVDVRNIASAIVNFQTGFKISVTFYAEDHQNKIAVSSQFFYPEIPEHFQTDQEPNLLTLTQKTIYLISSTTRAETIKDIHTLHQKALTEYVRESESDLSDEEND